MSSKVYFTNLRTKGGVNLLDKLERMVKKAGIGTIDFDHKFVALKIHFGEAGNMAFIRPNYAARMVKIVKELGGKPFLTDSNTLYKGSRGNALDHIQCALENGFSPITVGCNILIADGLKGTEYREIDQDAAYCPKPKIGAAVADADIVISLNHFKGHEQSGFGGALKNLGMGCASVGGKLELHSEAQPKVDLDSCTGCRICERNCQYGAITVSDERKASIDYSRCVGCGQCIAVCQYSAAVIAQWGDARKLNYKIDEYTQAVLAGKQHFHVSFIMNVSPECDCWGFNDAAIVPDLGIAASFDPVALDQACADLVSKAPTLHDNIIADRCTHSHLEDVDKFSYIHPDTDWQDGLRYAEHIGLGSTAYELITV